MYSDVWEYHLRLVRWNCQNLVCSIEYVFRYGLAALRPLQYFHPHALHAQFMQMCPKGHDAYNTKVSEGQQLTFHHLFTCCMKIRNSVRCEDIFSIDNCMHRYCSLESAVIHAETCTPCAAWGSMP